MKMRGGKRSGTITETDMVSMSDIAFLLIIFFMITTQFMRDNVEVDIPELPAHERTESGISVAMDKDGGIWLNGEEIDTPAGIEAELRSLLEGREEAEQRQVRFRCEADLTQKQYGPVMEAISAAGGVISIIFDRREES